MIELALLRRKTQFEINFNKLIESCNNTVHTCIIKIGLKLIVKWVPDFMLSKKGKNRFFA